MIERCYTEYEKFVKENASADTSVKSQLGFFLHGALSFYTEDLTFELDKASIHTWMKLMILYRVNKVFSDQTNECAKYRTTMEYYEFYRDRAIFKNVINVKNYFKNHLNELTELVRLVDSGISEKTNW